jgi:ubiquinone/menaquinone biosynthesis C-methylase UbiE
MSVFTSQQYWNDIGSQKDFEDPLYIEKLQPWINANSKIVEYGCGYGRLLQQLKARGYQDLTGYDFSSNMISRGLSLCPDLNLNLLEKSGQIPCQNNSVDAVVMSTVLCCMVDAEERIQLINEICRVLKPKGALYVSDFLVCDHPMYKEKYAEGFQKFGKWGMYTSSENLVVSHLTSQGVFELLGKFNIQWFEQFDFKTMNQNPARTFHCVAVKNPVGESMLST